MEHTFVIGIYAITGIGLVRIGRIVHDGTVEEVRKIMSEEELRYDCQVECKIESIDPETIGEGEE